jgi:hypothetical protein
MYVRVVLFIALFFFASGQKSVEEIVGNLEKLCPFYGFDGVLQCPNSKIPYPNNHGGITDTEVISGTGYDRVTREIRFPVLPSTVPARVNTQSDQTFRYYDVISYLNQVYTVKPYYDGGLFILEDSFVNQFASLFANYHLDMTVVQKLYNEYSTTVSSMTPNSDFLEIIATLPTTYNAANAAIFRANVIDLFGTDISIATTHGGIIFQQSALKSCYPGNAFPDMSHELDCTIAKVSPGALPYLRYRQLGVFDVKGGNPEIPKSQLAQIIASFPTDPAITGFTSVPLWQVVPAKWQAAVKAAIDDYTNTKQASINGIVASLNAQRLQSYKNPQNVFVYYGQTEQLGNILYWKTCPFLKEGGKYYTPRCVVNQENPVLGAGQGALIINYNYYNIYLLNYQVQRDPATGMARIVYDIKKGSTRDLGAWNATSMPYVIELESGPVTPGQLSNLTSVLDTITYSPWSQSGCVSMDFLHLTACPTCKLFFSICIDCQPVVVPSPARYGLKDTDLTCSCPGF